jgi:hypothetical protein
LVWLLIQQAGDQVTAVIGKVIRERGLTHENVHKETLLILRHERCGPNEHLVHQHTEVPEVLLHAVSLLPNDLRCEVFRVPMEHRPRPHLLTLFPISSEPEISELNVIPSIYYHVFLNRGEREK